MDDLKSLFPQPRLSPFFAARVTANLPEPRPAPSWMKLYWAALALFAAILLVRFAPLAVVYAAIPVSLGVTQVPRQDLVRWLKVLVG